MVECIVAVGGIEWSGDDGAELSSGVDVLSSSVVSGSDADVANSRGSGRYGGVAVTVSGVAARGVSVRSCGGVSSADTGTGVYAIVAEQWVALGVSGCDELYTVPDACNAAVDADMSASPVASTLDSRPDERV
jgi:hypothetical protein